MSSELPRPEDIPFVCAPENCFDYIYHNVDIEGCNDCPFTEQTNLVIEATQQAFVKAGWQPPNGLILQMADAYESGYNKGQQDLKEVGWNQ